MKNSAIDSPPSAAAWKTGDAKPTAGAYKVFEELSKELDGHLAKTELHSPNRLIYAESDFGEQADEGDRG